MKRGIVRMTEGGKVSMLVIDVWMTKEEIADMFGLPEASVFRTICSIYKKSELYEHETMRKIPFPRHEHQGRTMEVYNLDLILYLTYKLPIRNAQIFRKYMTNKVYERSPYEQICIIVDDVDFKYASLHCYPVFLWAFKNFNGNPLNRANQFFPCLLV